VARNDTLMICRREAKRKYGKAFENLKLHIKDDHEDEEVISVLI
jgi:hypothetical protein